MRWLLEEEEGERENEHEPEGEKKYLLLEEKISCKLMGGEGFNK